MTRPSLLSLLESIAADLREIKGRLRGDDTRPLTAEQGADRWNIRGDTPAVQLHSLARLCRQCRLSPMAGFRGWASTYNFASVLSAEGGANPGY